MAYRTTPGCCGEAKVQFEALPDNIQVTTFSDIVVDQAA